MLFVGLDLSKRCGCCLSEGTARAAAKAFGQVRTGMARGPPGTMNVGHVARVAGYVTLGARVSRRPKSTANVTYIHGNPRLSQFMAGEHFRAEKENSQ